MFLFSIQTEAKTIYIDLSLGTDCETYNPETRSCGDGTEIAFNSLSDGMNASEAGDTLLLRSGEYMQLRPTISGIIIKAYQAETPVISGLSSVAIWLEDISQITISGIRVEQCRGFGHIYGCENITIKNCIFDTATGSGTTSGLKFNQSSYCKILDNEFNSGGGDMVILQDNSNYNVFEGNSLMNSGHSLLSVRCCSNNIIRDNLFYNEDQKAIEIYDCQGTSDAPFRLDDTKHNVIENNEFTYTSEDTDDHSYNAIQHCAQYTIVRNNVFRDCQGGGVNYQGYADECTNTYSNRMYNNTFYNNKCYAIIAGRDFVMGDYYDHQVKNNLLYKNTNCTDGDGQTRIVDTDAVILTNNTQAIISPGFVDEDNNDFNLASNSSQIDSGIFVTAVTSNSGTGTSFAVTDASWFHDGFGIPDELGDLIQLEGQSQAVRIVGLNYDTNVLTVDHAIFWSNGQGVHLAYSGNRPEIGAFEYGQESQLTAPTNLRITP